VDDEVVQAWLTEHPKWQRIEGHLVRELVTTTYPAAVDVLRACVPIAEKLDHHPIVTVGYRTLRFEVWTHDKDGLTQLDLDFGKDVDLVLQRHAAEIVESR
jgi:4a-hydroxytetrahydrobiopterin dehydratase